MEAGPRLDTTTGVPAARRRRRPGCAGAPPGCLAGSGGDHAEALAGYEKELRPYVAENQEAGREGALRFGA
ncbi:hypothetical protein JK359_03700 [Streptomyces actinomycinicus]|uniref:Uncharacterized protein n=1 Tax=Streptomyces actinomycinicus TaxID=1695166 RepID=A0A937JK92_9ACTN|nr:hypothetical protein [Streptomyces actinomycinicus]MBL1081085.1 hypothetical protein [Streptomyces actinomycinicus]